MAAAETRDHLIEALSADLVGPFGRKPGEECSAATESLHLAPSRFYLTGFLAPKRQGVIVDQPDDDDELEAGDDTDDEAERAPEQDAKRRRHILASSMGLSVIVPSGTKKLKAEVCWADYKREKRPDEKRAHHWVRVFRPPVVVELNLDDASFAKGVPVPGSEGLLLEGHAETLDGHLTVAVFLVNDRDPIMTRSGEAESPSMRDAAYAFQTQLALTCEAGFIGRTNFSDEESSDFDERVGDLQYRAETEYAVGHGTSVRAISSAGAVKRVVTHWLPTVDVPRVEARTLDGVTVDMERLASFTNGDELAAALSQLPVAYTAWLKTQRDIPLKSKRREEIREELLGTAQHACKRIQEGIDLLANDEGARRSFGWMNEAMALAERRARPDKAPSWRLFQLAFILMNLPPTRDEKHAERKTVELIFFPTGGGKTQAYLGLIAFVLLERRVRRASEPDAGLGVAVLLRYTLRLLTLDQLGRAATLICALETLRAKHKELGTERYSIGLWVGRSATANRLDEVAKQVTEYKNDNSRQSPFPLAQCPWCNAEIVPSGFELRPSVSKPKEVLVGCGSLDCVFNLGKNRDGLPVLFVDEQVYREAPSFLIATVDKFALMPWRGETGILFGRALSRDGRKLYGPCDDEKPGVPLPRGLAPLELIVQDELHLISGPLGSMVGLYENVLLELAPDARLIASTATVRRAREQVLRLYGRSLAVFPPPAVDAMETFFAKVDHTRGARRYLGVAAPNRPQKAILLRVYVALLCAAAKAEKDNDAYLTLVGYFNALRELGGMRRLVEDDVRKNAANWAKRTPLDWHGKHPWFATRSLGTEPVELTSRESTGTIKRTKNNLALEHGKKGSIDVLLASNMISVGVDIDRLGLMVISGQPKTTAEYIQASSRVGRNVERPGLVVTCLNLAKPRDRSHYERFAAFHRSFYRSVEATSVTPYSAPALDRALASVVVALARLASPANTAPAAMMNLSEFRADAEKLIAKVAARAGADADEAARKELEKRLVKRGKSLLDAWMNIVTAAEKDGVERGYSPLDRKRAPGRALLHSHTDPKDELSDDERRFEAPLSMRDVEPSVHLWLTRAQLGGRKPRAKTE